MRPRLERLKRLVRQREPSRFYRFESNNLSGLKQDGYAAREAIDEQDDAHRDFLLERELRTLYPEERSQNC